MALAGGCRLFLRTGAALTISRIETHRDCVAQLRRGLKNANHLRQKFGSSYFRDDSARCRKFEKGQSMKIVAVTACPTGIAHTYMAAEQLEKTAKTLGHQ